MKYLKLIIILLSASSAFAQSDTGYPKTNYIKKEVYIPMRDGTKLFTAIYTPKDAAKDKKYSMIMQRTCYGVGPYGEDLKLPLPMPILL